MKPPNKRQEPNRRRRTLIIAFIIGVIVALPLIWFFSSVYDPFSGTIADLRSVIPADVDFYVEFRDLPVFLNGLDSGRFYSDLDRHVGFQRFLATPDVRATGIVATLNRLLRYTTDKGLELPLGLRLMGDVSGSEVIIAGYAPPSGGEMRRWMAIVRPESWMVIGAANALCRGTLESTLDERLSEQGIAVRRNDRVATLTSTNPRDSWEISLTVARDCVVLSGDPTLLAHDRLDLETPRVASRLRHDRVWLDTDASTLNFICSRRVFDRYVGVNQNLLAPVLGHQGAAAIERFAPNLDGEDVIGRVRLADTLDMELRVGCSERPGRDPISRSREIDAGELSQNLSSVLEILPYYVFGFAYQNIAPEDLVDYCFSEPEIVPPSRRDFWLESMGEYLPRFRGVAGAPASANDTVGKLRNELSQCFASSVGVALFTQQRSERIPKTTPGIAVVLRIRDKSQLLRLIDEIDGVRRDVRSFERYDDDVATRWLITAKGLVDDASVAQPGFAVVGDYFVFTNWFRMFNDMLDVAHRQASGFVGVPEVRSRMEGALPGSRILAHVDAEQLFQYFAASKSGWIAARTEISEFDKVAKRREITVRAERERIPPSARTDWIETEWRAWLGGVTQERNPARIEAEIDQKLGWFNDLFKDLSFECVRDESGLVFAVRVATVSVED